MEMLLNCMLTKEVKNESYYLLVENDIRQVLKFNNGSDMRLNGLSLINKDEIHVLKEKYS